MRMGNRDWLHDYLNLESGVGSIHEDSLPISADTVNRLLLAIWGRSDTEQDQPTLDTRP
jgi:hypothetical protein